MIGSQVSSDQSLHERMMDDGMMSISLRAARPRDAAAIADIHTRSWRDAYASILDAAFLAGPIEREHLASWTSRLRQPAPAQSVTVAEDASDQRGGQVGG